jgi:hypothetical protein
MTDDPHPRRDRRAPRLDADAESSRAHARGELPTSVAVVPAKLVVEPFRSSTRIDLREL